MQLPNSMCKYIFCNQYQSFNALQNGNVSVSPNKYETKGQLIKKLLTLFLLLNLNIFESFFSENSLFMNKITFSFMI